MLVNCDVIYIFPISGQFEQFRADSGRMVRKTYIFINSNLLSYKNWKQNQKIVNIAFIPLLLVKVLYLPKNADISKIKGVLVRKSIFSETKCVCVYLRTKFHVSGIILTRFRLGWG